MSKISMASMMLVASLALFGCRSKLSVSSENGAPIPKPVTEDPLPPDDPTVDPANGGDKTPPRELQPPEPTEVAGGLALRGNRTHFQSTETVTMTVDADVLSGAPTFSLYNVTTSETQPVAVLDEEPVPDELSLLGQGFSLMSVVQGDKLVLALHPSLWRGKFIYGLNTLKIVANDYDNPRFAYVQLTLRDFDLFGVLPLASVDAGEAQAAGFRGWVSVLSSGATAAPGATVASDLFDIVHPR